MGMTATDEDKRELLRLACGEIGPWLLLRLPSGQYGAFWKDGFETDQCILVAQGRYSEALPLIAESRELVEKYMTDEGRKYYEEGGHTPEECDAYLC